jgi:hypothetical protein
MGQKVWISSCEYFVPQPEHSSSEMNETTPGFGAVAAVGLTRIIIFGCLRIDIVANAINYFGEGTKASTLARSSWTLIGLDI